MGDPIRFVVVNTPNGPIHIEALPVFTVVDNGDRPVRWSDGSMWTTTAIAEAWHKRDALNAADHDDTMYRDIGVDPPPPAARRLWRAVVVR